MDAKKRLSGDGFLAALFEPIIQSMKIRMKEVQTNPVLDTDVLGMGLFLWDKYD